ncbi:MAG: hypothetical protein ACRD3O_01495, partial [Terriglobia bacterium]
MKTSSLLPSEQGIAKGAATALVIIIVIIIYAGLQMLRNPAPTIRPAEALAGIGLGRTVKFTIHDPRYRITQVGIAVLQAGRVFNAPVTVEETREKGRGFTAEASAPIGRREMPQLEQGRATIRVAAMNDSWGRFFRGGLGVFKITVPVRFMPPQIEVLTPQQYVNLGGCEMVIFSVSAGTVRSGVQVGAYYFPSWPVKETEPQTRLCLFAF